MSSDVGLPKRTCRTPQLTRVPFLAQNELEGLRLTMRECIVLPRSMASGACTQSRGATHAATQTLIDTSCVGKDEVSSDSPSALNAEITRAVAEAGADARLRQELHRLQAQLFIGACQMLCQMLKV